MKDQEMMIDLFGADIEEHQEPMAEVVKTTVIKAPVGSLPHLKSELMKLKDEDKKGLYNKIKPEMLPSAAKEEAQDFNDLLDRFDELPAKYQEMLRNYVVKGGK